jgi:transglutaminase-like putative cysteine protease
MVFPLRRLLLLALLPLPALAAGVDVRPAPAWVEAVPVKTKVELPRSQVRYGIYAILVDHQVKGDVDYQRRVRKVLSPSGVQNASELELDFDPSYQRLVLHDVAVLRDGKRLPRLDPETLRIIDKEDDAGEGIYDGRRTAILFLKDVRPGDILDYSWSIVGANPLLDGKYDDEYELSVTIPTRQVRHRLIWPASRPLRYGGSPAVETRGAERVLIWERRDVAATDVEDETPDWYDPWETVQVTETASWNEVARWSAAMFAIDDESQAAVKELADRIRAQHASQPAQITAAIRFVQDEVRYLGIELGRNSHEPHPPAEVLEQRWGDCKDKALLLSALLRELGVEAWPALVNTRLRRRLDQRLPSPFSFDHVIVQVVRGGRTHWVDATIADQGGTLETIETPNDERALVVRPETTALAKVVTNTKGATSIEQTYSVRDFAKPAELAVRSTYSGGDADAMRAELAAMSLDDMARKRINALAADQPRIEAAGLPVVHDDRERNVITIAERYAVRDLFADGSWTWEPRAIEDQLVRPETKIRAMPLAVPYPLHITEKATFHLPEAMEVESGADAVTTPGLRYTHRVENAGKTITITCTLRSLRDAIPPSEVAEHLTRVQELDETTGDTLTRREPLLAGATAAGAGGMGAGVVVVILIAIGAMRRRRAGGA